MVHISKTLDQKLAKTDTKTMDEKITAFPAVAGDIVFFTTTDFQPATACTAPIAHLYAFTFIGGAAYDTTGDGKVSGSDTPLVKSITGARATAPFVVDQHLAFAVGNKVQIRLASSVDSGSRVTCTVSWFTAGPVKSGSA
jgi:hypothetical protein